MCTFVKFCTAEVTNVAINIERAKWLSHAPNRIVIMNESARKHNIALLACHKEAHLRHCSLLLKPSASFSRYKYIIILQLISLLLWVRGEKPLFRSPWCSSHQQPCQDLGSSPTSERRRKVSVNFFHTPIFIQICWFTHFLCLLTQISSPRTTPPITS